jgi:hypothetical protein
LAVAQVGTLADRGHLILASQFRQTALQGAAADDFGQDAVQVVDADTLGVPGNLGFDSFVQVLGEFFGHGSKALLARLPLNAPKASFIGAISQYSRHS